MRPLPARTRAEAALCLALWPCPTCGELDTPWLLTALENLDGEPVERYGGECSCCGARRDAAFVIGGEPTTTRFGGDEPSRLLDAAQWLDVAAEAEVASDEGERAERLGYALDAVLEAMKFLPEGGDEVPPAALTSARGAQMLATEPLSLTRGWMESLRTAYSRLLAEGAAPALTDDSGRPAAPHEGRV